MNNNQGYNNQGYNNQGYNNQRYNNQGYNNQGYNNQGYSNQGNNNQTYNNRMYNNNFNFIEKNIALCIVFTIITLGIYAIYWLVEIVRNVHMLNQNNNSVVPEVLLIIFIPFYSWYWMYTRGKQIYEDSQQNGFYLDNFSVVYLILEIVGLRIINYALIQNDFNKMNRIINEPNYNNQNNY